MKDKSSYHHLNTIEDDRWTEFQKGSRQRRALALGATLISGIAGLALQSVWVFLAGEIGILLFLRLKTRLNK